MHGIGMHAAGYSEPLFKILRDQNPALVDSCRWREVAYDSVSTTIEAKVIQFKSAIPKSVENPDAKSVVTDMLVDLTDYLINADPYNWINTVYKKELVEIVEAGQQSGVDTAQQEIFIISHSLGTVVSYEALHAIIDDAQTLGITSHFRIKTLFTLGCPLAFIKANQGKIPSINKKFFLRDKPIGRPMRINSMTDENETNILNWYNLAQRFDPVASLTPLTMASSNNSLSQETLKFDAFHAGPNPHEFANYITEYASFLLDKIGA